MADPKANAQVKAPAPQFPEHEFDATKRVLADAFILAGKLHDFIKESTPERYRGPMATNIAIESAKAVQIMALAEVQWRYALVSDEYVEKGKGPGFDKAYEALLPRVTIDTPTDVIYIAIEESPKTATAALPFVHAHACYAAGMATLKAISDNPPKMFLLSRTPFDSGHWVGYDDKKEEINGHDFAAGLISQKVYPPEKHKVISVSLVAHTEKLTDHAMLKAAWAEVRERFGGNAMFVLGAGNAESQEDSADKHNALYFYSQSLIAGAANYKQHTRRDGSKYQSLTIADYSAAGAHVAWIASVEDARFMQFQQGRMCLLPMSGTSVATPHVSGFETELMRRFVASPENPGARLSPIDVMLAIKNTAQPLHIVARDNKGYNFAHDVPKESVSPSTVLRFVSVHKVGDGYVSRGAGNGAVQFQDAWALLEKQEAAVKEAEKAGERNLFERKELDFAIQPPEKASAQSSDAIIRSYPKIEKLIKKVQSLHSYKFNVADNLVTDDIVVDAVRTEIVKHGAPLVDDPTRRPSNFNFRNRPTLYLVSPAGEVAEVFSSSGYYIDSIPKVNNGFIMGRPVGMQNLPMQGEWTLLATEPLDKINVSFQQSMDPRHVGAMVVPDAKERKRKLYRYTDFTLLPKAQVDEMVLNPKFLETYDLSEVVLPAHYADIHLAMAVKNNQKDLANGLLHSCYGEKDKAELAQAVSDGDAKKILNLLIPAGERYEEFKKIQAAGASPDEVNFLYNNGFSGLQPTPAQPKPPITGAKTSMISAPGDAYAYETVDHNEVKPPVLSEKLPQSLNIALLASAR